MKMAMKTAFILLFAIFIHCTIAKDCHTPECIHASASILEK